MELSFFAKIVVVSLFVGVFSTQTNARRLYKWVDQGSVTNYSEFQPKEGTIRKVEVLESRGNDHVDPAMAVTAEMKPLEIPVDMVNAASTPASSAPSTAPANTSPSAQTVYKQGVLATPAHTVVSPALPTPPTLPSSNTTTTTVTTVIEKPVIAAVPEKLVQTVAVVEKKVEPAVVVAPEKKIQPKINPWTRQAEFVPSNLVPDNLPKPTNP